MIWTNKIKPRRTSEETDKIGDDVVSFSGYRIAKGYEMDKPTVAERIAQVFVLLAVVFCITNGFFMVLMPLDWYRTVPNVAVTGPANSHFIVDVGLAYGCSGITLLYGALYPLGRWLALVAGGSWLTVHGIFHVLQFASGHQTTAQFLQDTPGVLGPPALVIAALAILFSTQRMRLASVPRRGP